jgi:Presenilin
MSEHDDEALILSDHDDESSDDEEDEEEVDNNNNNNIGEQQYDDDDDEEEEEEEEEDGMTLDEQAQMVVTILKPVMITMLLVVLAVKTLMDGTPERITSVMVYNEKPSDSESSKIFGALLNSVLFVVMILVVTVLFVCLYKYRCMKLIFGWLILSTGLMLGLFGSTLGYLVMSASNVTIDWLSYGLIVWNFMVVGLFAIFWNAPFRLNQAYLIVISSLMAIWFTKMPEWTTWMVLAAIAIYDIFAVLCPRGPLKMLVELAQERNETIPALLYNSGSVFFMGITSSEEEEEEEEEEELNDDEEEELESRIEIEQVDHAMVPDGQERRSVKLGLGDFVFYSVLVGRASMDDVVTIFTCFVGVIAGLFMTLVCLALFRRALPALPFSIALGIIFFLLTKFFILPCVLFFGVNSIFL